MQALLDWGPSSILGLLPDDEAERLGLDSAIAAFEAAEIAYLCLPITDYGAPNAAFETLWPGIRDRLLATLTGGGRVFVHCRAGYGRSGTIAAALLISAGTAPADAIDKVRRSRPGAIETPGQEAWLHSLNPAE